MSEDPSASLSASVPNLRPRQPLFWVLIGLGGAALIAGAIVIIMVTRQAIDPGSAACDRIEELAKDNPAKWDRFVNALVSTVDYKLRHMAQPRVEVLTGTTRAERCNESFAILKSIMTYTRYEKLVDCVSKVDTFAAGSHCFDTKN